MSPYLKYICGCIEGPHPAVSCWQHGQPVSGPFVGDKSAPQRGVAQYIDCVMGRPISVWVINDRCNGALLCPSRYGCKYKPPQGKLL